MARDFMYDYIVQEIQASLEGEVETIQDALKADCEAIYKECLAGQVYYKPHKDDFYSNTMNLINSVRSEIIDGYLYIWHDLTPETYMNYSGTEDVTEYVPYWVNYGHGGLWSGEPKQYVELARDEIMDRYGIEVIILNPNFPDY